MNRRAYQAVAQVLPPTVDMQSGRDRILVNGRPFRVRWIGEGWLADVRPVLEEGQERPDLVVAHRMSPGARRALADAKIGWVDEEGAAEIAIGSIIVSKSGRPAERDQRITNWTPAVLAVAEAILCGTRPTVAGAREATGLSSGSCTNALRFLADAELLTAAARRGRDSGRRIADFNLLLRSYASAVAAAGLSPAVQVGVTWRDPVSGLTKAAEHWDNRGQPWACTGAVAASVLAPHLTSLGGIDVYVEANTITGLEAAARAAGLEPIEGGRLTLRSFPTVTSHRLSTREHRLNIAPWPRVYADLRLIGVRGEEAAEHLLEVMHAG